MSAAFVEQQNVIHIPLFIYLSIWLGLPAHPKSESKGPFSSLLLGRKHTGGGYPDYLYKKYLWGISIVVSLDRR